MVEGISSDVRPNPGHFEQHMLPVGMISNSTMPGTPPNINRFFLRAIEIYVAQNKTSAIVYSKMGRIMLFGFIKMPSRIKWEGTKLHVTSGTFGGIRKYRISKTIGKFVIDRAKRMEATWEKFSDRQWKIIEEAYRNNPDRAAQSEMIRAMHQDVALFGEAAFVPENKKSSG